MQLFRYYQRWHRANKERFRSKTHGNHMVTDYVNSVARVTWDRGNKSDYRPGAVLAKEGWKKGKRNMVWFMEKRRKGYDTDHGDWWYATLNAKGEVKNAGKVAMCVSCHDNAANDYVYGLPK